MLSSVSWTGSGDGVSWSNAANWSDDAVPSSSSNVTISIPASSTVALTGSPATIASLDIQSGTLAVEGNGTNSVLTTTGNITNAGTIAMYSLGSSYSETVIVGGTFANEADGTVAAYNSGIKTFQGTVLNLGTVSISNYAPFVAEESGGNSWTEGGNGTITVDTTTNSTFQAQDGAFNFNGGTITGGITLMNTNLSIGASSTGAASITLLGTNTLSGNIASAQALYIAGIPVGSNATLTTTGNVTNDGTIGMYSLSAAYTQTLVLGGTLTNKPDGTIQTFNSGTKTIEGTVVNLGTVSISNYSPFVAEESGGNSWTEGGNGTITVDTTTNSTFQAQDGAFNFNGGTITGGITLMNAALSIGAGSTGAAGITLLGSDTLTGNIASGQTLAIVGNPTGSNATLTTSGNVTNDGTIQMFSLSAAYTQTLALGGTLTNKPDGTIQTLNSGTKTIEGTVLNLGTVSINNSSPFVAEESGGNTWTEGGNGTITVDTTTNSTFQAQDGAFNFNGGTITGGITLTNTSLSIGAGSTGAASITLLGTNTLSGNIASAQALYIAGIPVGSNATLTTTGNVTNDGTIGMYSLSNPYTQTLLLGGTLTNKADGTIQTFNSGTKTIEGTVLNLGTVSINNSSPFVAEELGGNSWTEGGNGKISVDTSTNSTFQAQDGAFNFNGGTITGGITLTNATLSIGAGSTGSAGFTLLGSNTFSGNIASGQTLSVEGNGVGNNAALTTTGNVNNDGTIAMFSIGSSYAETVTLGGTFTNEADGTVAAYNSGTKSFTGTIVNFGVFALYTSTSFSGTSANDLNYGDIQILGGTASFSGKYFTNELEGLIGGTGSLSTSGTTFTNLGAEDLSSPSVTDVTVESSAISVTFDAPNGMKSSTVTNAANYTLVSSGGDGIFGNGNDVNLSADISSVSYNSTSGTATLALSTALPVDLYKLTMSGTAIQDSNGNTLDGGQAVSVVRGPLNLTAVEVSWTGGGDGHSWNDPNNWTGNIVPGLADEAVINAAGTTVNISTNVTVDAIYSLANLNISGGLAVTSGTYSPSGLVSITGPLSLNGGTLNVEANATALSSVNLSGGTITGTAGLTIHGTFNWAGGTLNESNTVTQSGITFAGSGDDILSGGTLNNSAGQNATLPIGGTLHLTSGAGFTNVGNFTNQGTVLIDAPSVFTVAGTFTQNSAATLSIQIGGTPASGDFGVLNSTGAATLGGTFAVSIANGFTVTPSNYTQVYSTYVLATFPSYASAFAAYNLPTTPTTIYTPKVNTQNVSLEIQGAPTVTATVVDPVYNGAAFPNSDITPKATGLSGALTLADGSFAYSYYSSSMTPLASAPTLGGSYFLVVSWSGDADFTSASSSPIAFTINRATPTLTVNGYNVIYSGTPDPASYTLTGINGGLSPTGTVTLTYYIGSTGSGAGSTTNPVAGGTYTVVASYAGDTNYISQTSSPSTFVISPATPTLTVAGHNVTYSGTADTASYSLTGVNGGLSPTGAVTLKYYVGATVNGTGSTTAPITAGMYTAEATYAGDANYITQTSSPSTFTISQAAPTLTVTGHNAAYTGSADAATYSLTGVAGGLSPAGSVTLTYYAGSTVSGTGTTAAPTTVGTYTVVASYAGDTNYTSQASSPSTFSISQATPTLTATGHNVTYTGTADAATYSLTGVAGGASPTGTVTLTYYVGSTVSETGTTTAPVSGGTYTVVASYPGDTNYSALTSSASTFTIGQAAPTLTVTGHNATYTGTADSATYSLTGAAGGLSPTGSVTLTYYVGSTVNGTGTTTAPTTGGTYTVVASYAGDSNYSPLTSSASTFTISQATSTLTVTGHNAAYTGNPDAATYSLIGVAGGTSPTGSVTLTYYVGPTVSGSGTGTAPTRGGTYTVVASYAGDTNYSPLTSTASTFSITQVAPTLTVTGNNVAYNGTADAASYSLTGVPGGLSPTGSVTLTYYVGSTVSGSGSTTAPVTVGTYTVVAAYAGDANYTSANSSPSTFAIGKAAPTLIATGHNVSYTGNADPASYSLSGVAGGVSPTGSVTLTYYVGATVNGTGTTTAPVTGGTYTVVASYPGDTNYSSVTSTASTFTIGRATPTLTVTGVNVTYTGSADAASYSLTGVAGALSPTGTVTLIYYAGSTVGGTGSTTAPTTGGTYTVVASYAGDANYSSESSSSSTFTISPATPTLTVTGQNVYYNGAYDPASYSLAGVNGGVSPTGTVTLTYYVGATVGGTGATIAPINAGTYTVVASYPGDANYTTAQSAASTFVIAVPQPLNLSGPAFYLRLNSDGQHLDVWDSAADTGAPSQSVLVASISSITVSGVSSGTALIVDFSNGDPLIASGMAFDGLAGDPNSLKVVGTPGNDTALVTANSVIESAAFATGIISYSNTSAIVFNGGTGNDVLIQSAQPGGGATLSFAGSTASDTLIVNSGTYVFGAAAAGSGIQAVVLGTLQVGVGATVSVAHSNGHANRTVLVVNNLTLGGTSGDWTGTLDLQDNDMIVGTGTVANLTNQTGDGYANGIWTGSGITSSAAASDSTHLTALGIELNNNGNGQPLFGSRTAFGLFDGQNPSTTSILIKYTYYGDTNLDGKVDGSDYSRIDNGYLTHLTGWSNGDFNYDGVVDGSDYTLIDNAFNTQGAGLAAQISSPSAVATAEIASRSENSDSDEKKPRPKTSGFAPTTFAASAPLTSLQSFDESVENVMQKKDLIDSLGARQYSSSVGDGFCSATTSWPPGELAPASNHESAFHVCH